MKNAQTKNPSPSLGVTDMHTAGEPVRIVTSGYPPLHGVSILDKRREAREQHDSLRRLLMLEPRGHSEMYGVIPVDASDPNCVLGVLFIHNEGYSTMCGHASIAMGRWIVDQGLVEVAEGDNHFAIECPCGPVQICARVCTGQVTQVSFVSVPSFAAQLDFSIDLPGVGPLLTDIGYGGAFYAVLPASRLGVDLRSSPLNQIKQAAMDLTNALRGVNPARHPKETDLSFIYGAILTEAGPLRSDRPNHHLCYFAEGQLDRSPTGSGVSARLALAHAREEIEAGQAVEIKGISNISFEGVITECVDYSGIQAVITQVSGQAHYSAKSQLLIEPSDPLPAGLAISGTAGELWN